MRTLKGVNPARETEDESPYFGATLPFLPYRNRV
jgi:hypothetical protein